LPRRDAQSLDFLDLAKNSSFLNLKFKFLPMPVLPDLRRSRGGCSPKGGIVRRLKALGTRHKEDSAGCLICREPYALCLAPQIGEWPSLAKASPRYYIGVRRKADAV
jgi:hypothetical protein